MSRYLKFLIPFGVFAVLVGFFIVGLQRDPRMIPSPLIGKPAPQFALQNLSDPSQQVTNADFKGRMYVFNVWGTWCGGCREEHGSLLAISRTSGVPIVGLNWKDDRVQALRWLKELGDPYAVVAFDPEGQVAIDWGVYGAPESFLVSTDGTILFKRIGPMTLDVWQREFLPLINGTGSGS
jgi:cytochrome c biogenesis protein CcmG/thiol:disulfide interchange protein DsbE